MNSGILAENSKFLSHSPPSGRPQTMLGPQAPNKDQSPRQLNRKLCGLKLFKLGKHSFPSCEYQVGGIISIPVCYPPCERFGIGADGPHMFSTFKFGKRNLSAIK